MRFDLETFNNFLKNVPLDMYREQYQHIKTVEQDLPKDMHALSTLYYVYWDKGGKKFSEPPTFEEFYKIYYKNCKDAINNFWEKSGYGKRCNCFYDGLKARIYRTWASIITQIHAGYIAESVFGKDTVQQSTELDHENIDFQINTEKGTIKIQVKKETKRREISRMDNGSEDNPDIKYIYYIVPPDYDEPRYKRDTKMLKLVI